MAIRNRNQKCRSSELLFKIATKIENFENFRNHNQKSIRNQSVSHILETDAEQKVSNAVANAAHDDMLQQIRSNMVTSIMWAWTAIFMQTDMTLSAT